MDEKTIKARVDLLSEILNEKKNSFNSMTETLKKVDGYAVGSKETTDKIEDYIRNQKKELSDLVEQGKIQNDVAMMLFKFFNNIGSVSRSISKEAEKIFHFKQGEIIFLKQEIEKLSTIKTTHETVLLEREKEAEKRKSSTSEEKVEKEQPRVRPDQDPKTRAGKAAIDLAERRKKARESLQLKEEKSQKKRGRKPKQN